MGIEMNQLLEGIGWLPSKVILSLFVVGADDVVRRPPGSVNLVNPIEVKSYCMEDPDRELGDRAVYEHDLIFDAVPDALETVVTGWLGAAVDAGAEVAWFGFEGSFHFDNLLTGGVAGELYGVADVSGVVTALDDERRNNEAWTRQVEDFRMRLLSGT
ncbi:hypothetical protein E0H75_19780 [Kribbella capetownensis]|uniref:Uncharacterized protein n=1 Tax=Kribbella capetownensis TaxID=1572659 RepID=A0A4R0K1W6_9ACTN|nr:hypothetical protein [Kribbella capetownensis]TCC48815.1 hypothetical protein E0H75_19780 [Kribbella capetownensis]